MSGSKLLLASLLVGTLAIVSGCKSDGSMGMSSSTPEPKVVFASPKAASAGVVYVVRGEKVDMLTTEGSMVCGECKADAVEFAKTGRLTEKCPVCGATRTVYKVSGRP